MSARLYVIPGSHPSMAARLMLEAKGIEYRRVDLIPVVSKAILRAARFPRVTVPALKIEGERVQGSRDIARALDRLRPHPQLVPSDPGERSTVEQAERWGDEELQGAARRILWWALKRDRSPLESFSEGARLGIPTGLAVKTAAPIVWASHRFNKAGDENVRHDLAALPGALDRIDGWIADGVLGREAPNVGDLQVGTCVRLLLTLDDLRPHIESRPAGELAMRVAPDYPGRVPPVLPAEWLEPLRSAAPSAA